MKIFQAMFAMAMTAIVTAIVAVVLYVLLPIHSVGRYQIVRVAVPWADDIGPPPGFKVAGSPTPTDIVLMVDTVTGKTWKLAIAPGPGAGGALFAEWWLWVGYRAGGEPKNEIGSRLPD